MYEWSVPVIDLAEKKGFSIDDVGPIVRKEEVESRIKKLSPDFIFLNGHGDNQTFYGCDDEPIIQMSNADLLNNKIVFARTCCCAETLGKKAVEKHECTAFVGYKYEFFNIRQTTSELVPTRDEVSKPIWEISNVVPMSLIKGSPVNRAIESSHKKAFKEIAKLVFSKELTAKTVLKVLLANQEGLIYHGDETARL
jgi:hypothetical protein